MPRRLCGCSPRRRNYPSTIIACAPLLVRREQTFLSAFLRRPKIMKGIGDKLGPAIGLPKLFALLVNPQIRAPTREVFAALGLAPGSTLRPPAPPVPALESDPKRFWDLLSQVGNDLVGPAIQVAPAIAIVLKRLSQIPDARAVGMSGSGATCFALFGDRRGAAAARRIITTEHPGWWVEATRLR